MASAKTQVKMLLREMKFLHDQVKVMEGLAESMLKRADWIEAELVSVCEAIKAMREKEDR